MQWDATGCNRLQRDAKECNAIRLFNQVFCSCYMDVEEKKLLQRKFTFCSCYNCFFLFLGRYVFRFVIKRVRLINKNWFKLYVISYEFLFFKFELIFIKFITQKTLPNLIALMPIATGCNRMQLDATGCNGMQWDATGCNRMQQDATGCSGMQQDAMGCNRMQQDATGIYENIQTTKKKRIL